MRSSGSMSACMGTDRPASRKTSGKLTSGWPSATCSRTTSSTCLRSGRGARAHPGHTLRPVLPLGQRTASQPVQLLPDVAETVRYLAGRHDLMLLTKGHPEEQRLKIERSGLEPLLTATAVVHEKGEEA